MKGKIFTVLVLLMTLLPGCGEKQLYIPPVVTEAEVTYRRGQEQLTCRYREPEKLERVLNCLRGQEFAGYAPVDPERLIGEELWVRLSFSDGSSRVYRQKNGQFQSRDSHRWRQLRKPDRRLNYLLRIMPPDPVAKPAMGWYNN